MKSLIKFFVKAYLLQGIIKILLFLNNRNKQGKYSNRILIIDTQAIGDLVVATGTFKHYQSGFPDKKIDFLIKESAGMEELLSPYCHQVITFDYDQYKKNPLYAYRLIKKIQATRYDTVIVHDHAIAEMEAKKIAILSKAKKTILYEGFLLQQEKPLNLYMKLHCRYVIKNVFSKATQVITSFDRVSNKESASVLEHYQYFYEQITQKREVEYESVLKIPESGKRWRDEHLKKYGIEKKKYVVFTLGSSSYWKNWPLERFEEVARYCHEKGISIVVTGSRGDWKLGKKIKIACPNVVWDATAQTTLTQSAAIIENALFVVSNDTSSVHIAIALKTPCVCIIGTGQLGSISLYGHPDIHYWIYKKGHCYLDNWRCVNSISYPQIAPCINEVTTQMVIDQLEKLLQYLETQAHVPNTQFQASYTQ